MVSHSFKLLPNIGKHIVALIEDRLPEDLSYAWRWRPGGDALTSRRAAAAQDLADMPGWNHDEETGDLIDDSLSTSLKNVQLRSQL
jgi:hypothetical protein